MPGARRFVLLAVATLLAGVAVWLGLHSSRAFFELRALLSRFPAEDALVVNIDFKTLRAAGLLGQSKTALEPEYKQFVEGTGFDYRRDLDLGVASFSHSGSFFIARGRFDWRKLKEYAVRQGGSCYQELCRMQGSTPQRHISFLPLRKDAIALAVSTDDLAASRLTRAGTPLTNVLPSAPVWISVPGSELRQQNSLPPLMHAMLSALRTADRVIITLAPGKPEIEAHLEATCRTQDDAKVLASQLRSTTGVLKEAVARDKKAAGDEIVAMLTAGTFDQSDRRVTGKWPVRKNLLDALTEGI